MVITYHGDGYFRLQSGERTILIDPTNQRSFKGTTVVVNTVKPSLTEASDDHELFWIDHEGEYEVNDIVIQGWSMGSQKDATHEYTAYRIDCDDITFGILGVTPEIPSQEIIGVLQGVDILIIPQGGKEMAMNSAEAAKIARQVESSVVIPSYINDVKIFFKELGHNVEAPEEKFVCKKKDFVPKALHIKFLKA